MYDKIPIIKNMVDFKYNLFNILLSNSCFNSPIADNIILSQIQKAQTINVKNFKYSILFIINILGFYLLSSKYNLIEIYSFH